MKRILVILILLIPLIVFGQRTFKDGLIVEDSLRIEGFARIIDSLISDGIAKFNDGIYLGDSVAGSSIAKLDSFILDATDTAFYSWGRRIGMGGSAFVGWGKTIIVATTGGDYTTVQAAINAANAWDVIVVHPGTYDEKLTIDKNLGIQLKPGTVLDYTVNNATYTVTVNSGVTAYIMGGILRRTAASHGRVIENGGILHITSDIENSTESVTYMIDNFADAELFIRNHKTWNTNYSLNNRAYLDGTVYINTQLASFQWMIDSAANVSIEAEKIMVDSNTSVVGYVQGGSKLSMDIGLSRYILYDGVEIEGYCGHTVRDSSEFYYTGNYNFSTSAPKSGKVILHDAFCLEGEPRIGVPNDADSNCLVDISNCYFKWIYPARMRDGLTPPTGQHYFENASDTAEAVVRIYNSYIQWSEPVAMGVESRELGNIFYWNGGKMFLSNSTFVDYNDDYQGYGNMGVFTSSKRTRIYNCQFQFYGHQSGPMFSMLDRAEGSAIWDIEFQNCHFARRESDYTGSFFDWSWQYRHVNDSDHVVFQNCTFEDDSADNITIFSFSNGGAGYMPFEDFIGYIEGNIANDQYIMRQRAGDIRMIGPGHFSTTKEYFGYRVKMNDWASYEGLSVEDTVNMIITWKEEIGAAENGEVPRRNWLDLDMSLMIRDSSLVDAPYYFKYYDIRATVVQPGDGTEVMVDTNVFHWQAGIGLQPKITWAVNQVGDAKYIQFEIINRDLTYALTLDVWIRQSLNIESIEFIEPYEE